MNRDEIAQMMQDTAGANWGTEAHFQKFAALVAAHEREACALVCERAAETIWRGHETAVIEAGTNVCNNVAAAIRARGEK